MNLFIIGNDQRIRDLVTNEMEQGALAFVCEDNDRQLIIFGKYFERYELPEILKAAAAKLPECHADYRVNYERPDYSLE